MKIMLQLLFWRLNLSCFFLHFSITLRGSRCLSNLCGQEFLLNAYHASVIFNLWRLFKGLWTAKDWNPCPQAAFMQGSPTLWRHTSCFCSAFLRGIPRISPWNFNFPSYRVQVFLPLDYCPPLLLWKCGCPFGMRHLERNTGSLWLCCFSTHT